VGAWFDNLLPDSPRLRERIAARFNTKGKRAFDLLAEVGRDSVGAIRLLPEGFEAEDVRAIHAQPMTHAEIAQLLRNTASTQPWFGDQQHADDFRISLAGAQEKTALLRLNGQWMRPLGATPTTHILKLPLGLVGNMQMNMAASVENEWLCAQVIKAYGLPVAECDMAQFEDIKPRHWHELAKRHGVPSAGADSPFEQVIAQTPVVIATVRTLLPAGFPLNVSESILTGLTSAAKRFVQTASH
jgi:serine/threonine-protein kinase HipA